MSSDEKAEFVFLAEFASSQIFRQILEYLKPTISNIPIVFTKNDIIIIGANDSKTLSFKAFIETCNLMEYYLNPDIRYDEEENPYKIYINIESVLTSIKNLPKKGFFKIFQKISNPEYITLTVTDPSPVTSVVRLIPSEPVDLVFVEENGLPSNLPNKTILLSKFAHTATGVSKNGGKSGNIKCYPYGVEILGSTTDKDCTTKGRWGTCTGKEICDIKVSSDIMKSITKISNITTEAIVRFYCNNPYYIRMEIPIATIGTAYIYISKSSDKY